ncbi:MAG: InlB B-repeat-containing protein [Eubacteriales bacterium]|nr:InlB B-repeat-containing protein [Eubacteriales bacterium]
MKKAILTRLLLTGLVFISVFIPIFLFTTRLTAYTSSMSFSSETPTTLTDASGSSSESASSSACGNDPGTAFEDETASKLRCDIEQGINEMLERLESISDHDEGYAYSESCAETIYSYYDEADSQCESGIISDEECDLIYVLLDSKLPELNDLFLRFGYSITGDASTYRDVSGGISIFSFGARYEGGKLYIDFKLYTNYGGGYIHNCSTGWNETLLYFDCWSDYTTDKTLQERSSSSFGSITFTGSADGSSAASATRSSVNVAGYVTITNVSGFKSWYENGYFVMRLFKNANSSYEYVFVDYRGTSLISNYSQAVAQATCSHSSCSYADNGSNHKVTCNTCGTVSYSGHNSSRTDTSSVPGYKLIRCSLCGHEHSRESLIYTVTIVQGSSSSQITVIYGSLMPSVTPPERTGYDFGGYYSGQNGTGTKYYNSDGTGACVWDQTSDSISLYAYWIPHTYTVVFNRNAPDASGAAPESMLMTYDTSCTLNANTFTRSYYEFSGWSRNSFAAPGDDTVITDMSEVRNLSDTQDDTVTLYAVWKRTVSDLKLKVNADKETAFGSEAFIFDIFSENDGFRYKAVLCSGETVSLSLPSSSYLVTPLPVLRYSVYSADESTGITADGSRATVDFAADTAGNGLSLTFNAYRSRWDQLSHADLHG